MACLGFLTVENGGFRRCRNWACLETEPDGQVVRGFFCAKHKKSKIVERAALRSRLLVASLARNLENKAPWMFTWVEELLASGYIEIRHVDLQRLEARARYLKEEGYSPATYNFAVLLVLIARHVPEFKRSWTPLVWSAAVTHLWKLRQSYGQLTITDRDIASLICVKGDILAFTEGMRLYPNFGAIEDHSQGFREEIGWREPEFYRFLSTLAHMRSTCEWYEEWILEPQPAIDALKATDARAALSPVVQRFLTSDEFHAWRKFEKEEWRSQKRLRMESVKEELVAATWEPSRFMDWCLDWEEKREMEERWAPEPVAVSH